MRSNCAARSIEDHRGARAEALMREHARLAHRNLRHVLQTPAAITQVRSGALIGRAHPATAGSSRPTLLPGVSHA
ncbi:hypothetical protein FHT09_002338 [Xanthomonas arboricola]|uniref:hypothetical protein n=1 Tax=Xanthomonas TaxID=338 RepID=UPI00180793D7|nr:MULTISPECIES: hypothetical protein [Xanthomonas]MBB5736598.1 hypothetical protein [Xanthomonas sp. CFBP 8152]